MPLSTTYQLNNCSTYIGKYNHSKKYYVHFTLGSPLAKQWYDRGSFPIILLECPQNFRNGWHIPIVTVE